ncbi:MAG: ATP-binding cassette domain-containing protein [Burkholderiaceae bacterium]|uniref:ATP-binding cassette domain-containing protein n=1 Tax=Herminiimonas contaminans TaxID=1111140 RepID=A0ABS0EQN2_9BURK|nr:ATP-binding cassette domain-containing protein [Herminiimonas contaminans]MBF8177101.1 ATP-binding cassette domain-containing protein [Herminiimonas contaminans]MBX9797857.1 ATP-binding cassette domain-containing protein [Burkholderiaceae bacterium]
MSKLPDLPDAAIPAANNIAPAQGDVGVLREALSEITRDPMYITMLRAYGKRLVEIVVAGFLINLFGLLLPVYSRLVYDKVIGNHIPDTLWALTLGMLLFLALEFVLRVIRTFYVEQLAGKFDIDFDQAVVKKLLAARVSWPVGVVLAKYRDITGARDLLSSNYMLVIIDFPFLLLYLLAIGLIGGPIVWVVLVGGALLVSAQLLCKIPANDYARTAMMVGATKTDKLAGLVYGIETLKTSALQKRVFELFTKDAEDSGVTQAKSRFWSSVGFTISSSGYTLMTVATLVVGVYMVEANALTVGALIASSMLVGRAASMLSSVAMVLGRIDAFKQARTSFEELFVEAPNTNPTNEVDRQQIEGKIQVANLGFSIKPGEPAMLKQISFVINPGEKVGLVGRSGSGKSTLLRCLAGVHAPDTGQVLMDGISVAAYPQEVRMRSIAYKPQDPFLFDGTLASNIFVDNTISTSIYQTALHVSCMDELLAGGQLRLDQLLVAPGNLSGGQRQMVALARAIATVPNVLLLDEPTTGIDQGTENKIIERLVAFAAKRTLVVATHSPVLLKQMDRIIVIHDGKIVADGPRAQILL